MHIREEIKNQICYYQKEEEYYSIIWYKKISSIVSTQWREVIANKHSNGRIEIISMVPPRIKRTMNTNSLLCDNDTTEAVQLGMAIAATDS